MNTRTSFCTYSPKDTVLLDRRFSARLTGRAFLFSLSLFAFVSLLTKPAAAEEYTVKMLSGTKTSKYRFEPEVLKIKPGDTVVWVNAQNEPHDVMAEAVPKGAASWNSPYLTKKGESWSYTFTIAGTYDYHCHPHEGLGMVGQIIVGDASTAAQSMPVEGHHQDVASDEDLDHHHQH